MLTRGGNIPGRCMHRRRMGRQQKFERPLVPMTAVFQPPFQMVPDVGVEVEHNPAPDLHGGDGRSHQSSHSPPHVPFQDRAGL
jgi:hypothetical protein